MEALWKANAVIVLNNASYHKGLPLETHKGTESEYKTEIWQKLKSYIKSNVMSVVVTMAAKRGHTVKYTPPYHLRLQPIELVWACVKGRVGRQYSVNMTLKDVRRRLDEAFDSLPADIIYKCIENRKSEVMRLDKYNREIDARTTPTRSTKFNRTMLTKTRATSRACRITMWTSMITTKL
ncbi:hypothetical protein ACHHYP_20850 [Achlya hypogyna]|uniref:Tc1-like transposase DDE domain-containing protein n=1 Tax=Achlya hypogyna TaxID=1202772 RepID=A0A1V9ZDL5_ACHHY|nr:hypothetical protein ACHHYP_20850 [Achlya hypogyna]